LVLRPLLLWLYSATAAPNFSIWPEVACHQ
jgi:hypothetical protein